MNNAAGQAWLPHNPRDRRILAVALLLLVIALVVAAVAVPVVLLNRHYDQNLAKMTRQWKSQSTFNSMRPQVARALELLRAKDVRKFFLKGTTSALASAELQDQVRQVVEANGGRLISASANPHKDDGAYRFATANFQLNINNANLRRMLYALEAKEPYLFNDNLVIRSQVPFGYRPPPGTSEPDLFVQMDVSAIAYVGTDGSAGAAGSARPPGGGK
jgi:general secretion pathway protein M